MAYLGDVFHFNFGTDLANFPTPVSQILDQAIPWTLILVGTATVIAFLIGTAFGILAGWRHGGWLDRALPVLTFFQAAPYFFVALLLVYFLALKARWLPPGQGFDASTGRECPGGTGRSSATPSSTPSCRPAPSCSPRWRAGCCRCATS